MTIEARSHQNLPRFITGPVAEPEMGIMQAGEPEPHHIQQAAQKFRDLFEAGWSTHGLDEDHYSGCYFAAAFALCEELGLLEEQINRIGAQLYVELRVANVPEAASRAHLFYSEFNKLKYQITPELLGTDPEFSGRNEQFFSQVSEVFLDQKC